MDTTPITLDRDRQLRYTWGAMNEFKEKTGLVFGEFGENDEHLSDFQVMATLLWAGLVWEDETLTVEQVANMVDVSRTAEVLDIVVAAMGQSSKPQDPTAATASDE